MSEREVTCNYKSEACQECQLRNAFRDILIDIMSSYKNSIGAYRNVYSPQILVEDTKRTFNRFFKEPTK